MKTMRLFCRTLVVPALLGAFILPTVSAQLLDDVWFKLKLSAKGRTLDTNGVTVAKLNLSSPVYLEFVATTNAQEYAIHVWTQVDTGWTNAMTSTVQTIGTNENFLSDFGIALRGPEGNSIHIYHTVFIGIKANSTGAVQSAIYDGVGEINSGDIDGKDYYGGCTLKGTKVDSSKLPFTP